MTNKLQLWLAAAILAAFVIVALFLNGMQNVGAAVTTTNTVGGGTFVHANLFASSTLSTVTATGTVGTAFSDQVNPFFDSNGRRFDGTLDLRGANHAEVYFTRGGAFGAQTTGTTTFTVEVTPDGTNWYTFNRLVSATTSPLSTISNTSIQSSALIGDTDGVTLDATTTQRFSLDLNNEVYLAARCKVVTTLNGSASCDITARYGL